MFRFCRALLLMIFASAGAPVPASSATSAGIADELAHAARTNEVSGEPVQGQNLVRLYGAFGNVPLWKNDRANQRHAALTILAGALYQGIELRDLHADALTSLRADEASNDVLLSDALLRYVDRMAHGAEPSESNDWAIAPNAFDSVTAVAEAMRTRSVARLLVTVAPSHGHYRRLLNAYSVYSGLRWSAIKGDKIDLTDDTQRAELRARLAAEGDLAPESDEEVDALPTAVRRFQARHGLEIDGRVGHQTLAALNIPPEVRQAQIAAALDTWRRLPHDLPPKYVLVNTPAASLEVLDHDHTVFDSRVVVGDPKHPTPVLAARINAVTFNPHWDIPTSIITKEIIPKWHRDPQYLQKNDMVVIGQQPLRLQQRPGSKNALGAIKFEMPNPLDVYLHDSPARQLFAKTRRAFSHGCVRVERPHELAVLLLNSPDWSSESIDAAIATGTTRTLALKEPLPVLFIYVTAFVDESGQVNFRDDIYQRDQLNLPTREQTEIATLLDSGGCWG